METSSSESTNSGAQIEIEVAYATPDKQLILTVSVAEDCSVYDAAVASGIDKKFPEINLESSKMGIFSKLVSKPKLQTLKPGDRIEVYRPLLIDPKESRKNRAAKVKAEKGK
ncbi:MAG: RnfH family protein [Pseudomonadales bacterium]|nr:RnfH family protein [Pseudomonadales bacterium]